MPNVQPDYREYNVRATLGMVGNMELWNAISLVAEDGNVAFGGAVGAGTDEHRGKPITTGASLDATVVVGTNTGNGVLTPSLPFVDPGSPTGAYTVTILADTGTFSITGPSSYSSSGVVGEEFNGPINFTLADGTVAFVAGDVWTVTVAASAPGAFRGIAIRDTTLVHSTGPVDMYQPGDIMAVLTKGTIWVIAAEAVVPGDVAYHVAATGRYGKTASGNLAVGGEFDTAAGAGELVRLRLK